MRFWVVILFAMLAVRLDAGEDLWRVEWARKGAPLTQRVCLVVDASGSMRGAPLRQARQQAATILSMFPDEGHVKVYAFDDAASCMGEWRRLPDADLLDEIDVWLAAREGVGSTDIAGGVEAALANHEDGVSVILITDGDPSGRGVDHLARIERAQDKRPHSAPIHVLGVTDRATGWGPETRGFLEAIASRNSGSLVLVSPKPQPKLR